MAILELLLGGLAVSVMFDQTIRAFIAMPEFSMALMTGGLLIMFVVWLLGKLPKKYKLSEGAYMVIIVLMILALSFFLQPYVLAGLQ